MKILVTGATGFLGNHVIPELINRGHEVIATARSLEKAKACSWYRKVLFVPYDFSCVTRDISIYHLFNEPDILIHLAWDGLPNFKDLIHIEQHLHHQYLFLKNYLYSGGKHVLVTGTCLEYGMQSGCLSEDMPTDPVTAYGVAKNSLRQFIDILQKHQHPFVFQWVRLFYMYGDGQHTKSIIPQLQFAIANGEKFFNMSGGDQTRDYLHVSKVAEYISKIAEQKRITGIINCCSGNPISIKLLVKEYTDLDGSDIQFNYGFYPYNDYEPMHFWGKTDKLKNIIHD
jgi:dTDP-6-deoxy-L-talose 4-dehydrogenase (NAD+)